MISAIEEGRTASRARGYGLPCVKCHTYYFADLDSCPICKNRDRVGLVSAKQRTAVADSASAPTSDPVPVQHLVDHAPVAAAEVQPESSADVEPEQKRTEAISDCWSIILSASKEKAPADSISAGQLRARFVHVLEEVSARQKSILITKRGKPVAKIVPALDLE